MKIRRRHRIRNTLLAVVTLGVATSFVLAGVFLLWATTLTMPTIEVIEQQRHEQSTKIYDRTGEVLLYDMHQDVRRTFVPLQNITQDVKYATIAIEDDGFYDHYGVEPLSIIRAVLRNLQAGDLFGGQGGSTITQQVVKNVLLVKDKKISRKLKEWVLAIKLERMSTKDKILEMYLNEAPYGGNKYGIEEAAQGFFGKSSSDLTLAESAYLAALPQAPTYYSPYGNNRDALEERKNLVLDRMLTLGYISQEQHDAARSEKVDFRPHTGSSIKAPHFVFYVIDELSKTYGDAELAEMNLKVITTLDWDLEREAERIVYDNALKNETTYNASNASLMAIDPRSGEILVMVGSRDYFDEKIDGNFNIGLSKRQPGSSFKPFAYAAAIAKGYTTETVVYDVHTQFSTNCAVSNMTSDDGCYAPANYDNKFRGPMTFREALAQSVNVPAVKVLYLAGMKDTIDLARTMGITTLEDYKRYGLTLVLGGGEVSLLEMTNAYATFAHEGYRFPKAAIKEVFDGSGKSIFTLENKGEQVLDSGVARSITNILNDNNARAPAFGSNSYLFFPGRDVAVKTGTTNDYRDAWIMGYTPTIAVGAWAGNNNNTPMEKKVAGFIVAPMWHEFLQAYFDKYPEHTTFEAPPAIDPSLKPVLRGYKGPSYTSAGTSSDIVEEQLPVHDILYWVYKDDPLGPIPSNPAADPQYGYWEYGVAAWRIGTEGISTSTPAADTNTASARKPSVTITRPDDGERVRANTTVRVGVSVESDDPIERIEYFIDGTLVNSGDAGDRTFNFMPGEQGLTQGDHTILVTVTSDKGARGGDSVDFSVR